MPTLMLVSGKREPEIHEALWDAVRANLIVRTEDAYQFLHDRIREAAYALVPESERPGVHLEIGRRLLAKLEPAAVEERLFEVVTHFGRGISEITSHDEKDAIARLALRAGSKAKASVAFESARTYLTHARDLLPDDAWSTRYDLAFPIHRELAECEYLVGDIAAADAVMETVLASARSPLDRVEVYQLRLQIHHMAGRNGEAIRAAYEGLRLFGLDLPEDDEAIRQKTRAKAKTVRRRLANVYVPGLANLPVITDPQRVALVGLLVDSMPASFISYQVLFPLITLEAIEACLDHGNTADSCVVYSGYAILLASLLEDIPAAYRFSELALHLDGKFEESRRTGMTLFVHGAFVNSWRRHLATSTAILERAFASALDVGDFVHAGHACSLIAWNAVESGAPLAQVIDTTSRYSAFAIQSHNDGILAMLRLVSRFAACLEGQTHGRSNFDDATFSEADYLDRFKRANNALAQGFLHVSKQIVHFLHSEFEEALEHAERAAAQLGGVMSTMLEATHYFYLGLTLTALYETASQERKRAFDGRLVKILAKLEKWAENGPENHANRYLLLSAEVARIRGDDPQAMRLYRDAIRSARDNGFIQNEAVAYELGSRFHASRGFDDFAETYFRGARARYARWGAKAKVAELDQKPIAGSAALSSPAFDAHHDHLDLLSVVKASQRISEEIRIDKLAGELLEVVLELSGAQRARLLLGRDGSRQMSVEATATMSERGIRSELVACRPADVERSVPLSVVNYVQRTKTRVIIDDASADAGRFAKDEHFTNTRARSVLALPILRQSELIGVLYLENEQLPRAFSRGQLTTLELLASQAAISLQNARLYEAVERENVERKQAEEALRVSQEQLQLIIDSAPAVIFAKDLDGRYLFINRRFEELFHVRKDFLLGMTDGDILPQNIADSNQANDRAVLESGIPTEWEEVIPQDDGLHTYISLKFPLFTARGEPYAVCGISTDITERTKAEAEREILLAQERAARLEAQKSVQIRDDFISIASHELRTPITPLKMYLQVLKRAMLGVTPESFPKAASLVKALEKTDTELKRLERLIEDLLNVTRISAGNLDLDLQEFDLSQLVRETLERHEAEARKAKCEFHAHLEPGVTGKWDRMRLDQVVSNLLTNAIKYGAGKPIEVTVEKLGDHARLSVRDHGIGIAKEAQAAIFERFGRVAPIQHYGGLGLGLYISHEFVAAHGGHISVESAPGQGSTFSVDLPLEPPAKG
ncbi:Signal transduction histidine kinase CheA [Labilithrix luteola]|uniref:histidine kinase n=1 Tax=Labilithrix luteola TaxID=1391654 RepID=A0A0K1PNS3_9BACT|nr:Signal transduction histidine kinase CheA [Labilithrix luteola]